MVFPFHWGYFELNRYFFCVFLKKGLAAVSRISTNSLKQYFIWSELIQSDIFSFKEDNFLVVISFSISSINSVFSSFFHFYFPFTFSFLSDCMFTSSITPNLKLKVSRQ